MEPDFLHDLFCSLGEIAIRRMFGGQGVYHQGVMFALVADEELYLKVDDETAERFRAAGSNPFIYRNRGREIAMSYWRAPDCALDDPDEMGEWARLAVEAARRGQSRKRKPGRTA